MNLRTGGRRAVLLVILPALLGFGCARSNRPFDPKHDGRYKRLALTFPLSPFVFGWMGYHILTEDRGPQKVDFKSAALYEPSGFAATDSASSLPALDRHDRELLEANAPLIVQQQEPEAKYAATVDRIGSPTVHKTLEGKDVVHVNTEQPRIYTFVTQAILHGQPRKQLNYVYWFPEHPNVTGGFDPERGKIEGITVRLTLDGKERPMFYETVHNCGCYHRVYPAQWVEDAAREKVGPPLEGKFTSVARKIPRKIDLYAPEAVPDGGGRLVLFSEAGRHSILSVGRESAIADRVKETHHVPIALAAYEALETGGQAGHGIFGDDTLVLGSDRPEAIMLIPTGLYHAGTPRRRGAQLIHFDMYDFDDPRLLENALRLPADL